MNADRIEDCLAKDEQIRRLRVEVQAADARAEAWAAKAKAGHWRLLTYLCGAFVGILFAQALLSLDVASAKKYPCYFVETESGNPWDRWRIRRDSGSGSDRVSLADQRSFSDKNEAWNFLTHWKVEVCR